LAFVLFFFPVFGLFSRKHQKWVKKMRMKLLMAMLLILVLAMPPSAEATTVYQATGWLTGSEGAGVVFDFDADVSPYTYVATLTDLSVEPYFGFDFLFLSITTATDTMGSIVGPGKISFVAIPDETYFANIFGIGGGDVGTGSFGLKVTAVPIPPALMMLGSGLLAFVALKRRN
jgi:hypothetical protein